MDNNGWKKLAVSGLSSAAILGALVAYYEPSPTPGVPYKDVTEVPTNCQGNTKGVDLRIVYTPEQCKIIDDSNKAEDLSIVDYYVKVSLTVGQRAAFADFVHNFGASKFKTSTMLRYINEGRLRDACNELPKWKNAQGKELPGLVARRGAEQTICLIGVP